MTGRRRPIVFLVHVAGEPGPDHVQRCVACHAELIDNRGWYQGTAATLAGDDRGPGWWPSGGLIATDKPTDGAGGGVTYVIDDGPRELDDDELPCTPAG